LTVRTFVRTLITMSAPEPPPPTRQAERPPDRLAPALPPEAPPAAGPADNAADSPLDLVLMWRVAEGDAAAFEELYRRHAVHLSTLLRGRFRDAELCSDIAQAAWMNVWRYAHLFTHGEFRAWLWRVARNAGVRMAEGAARAAVVESWDGVEEPRAGDGGDLGVIDEDYRRALRECVAEVLTANERRVIERLLADNSPEEILAADGVTPDDPEYRARRQRLYNAKATAKPKLRDCIQGRLARGNRP
jgi:RNA polymerase sigma-70 factor (ECF subfamily)